LTWFAGGNSDGIYSYVQLLCFAIVAVAVALIWTILDHRPSRDERIAASLRTVFRYVVSFTMLGYGMIKVIPTQFYGLPSLFGLVRPYGDLSRFDVLWNFMGTSPGYTIFTGAVEVAAALLLLFRRTTTLGALVAVGALVNVGALDFAYGVPEKLHVMHLLAMTLVVLAPDLPRLANVLVFNRPVAVIETAHAPASGRRRIAWTALTVLVAYELVTSTMLPFSYRAEYAPPGPLYGIYQVATYEVNGQPREPLTTDSVRWRRIVFGSAEDTYVEMMDGSWSHYATTYQTAAANMTLKQRGKIHGTFHYEHAEAGPLFLRGTFDDAAVTVSLARVDESAFRLVKSRFRWINGEP
jgi:hypothetical protein